MDVSQGRSDDFADLVRPHLNRLYRLAYRLTGAKADAEDLVQDVLIKLYARRDELTAVSDLGPWLGRILFNRFVDQARQQARRRLTLIDPAVLEASPEACGCDCDPGRPEERAASELSIMAVERACRALSIEHRTVLLMHDAEGYKLKEIQQITGVPEGTLKSRLQRARARLRELLEIDGTF